MSFLRPFNPLPTTINVNANGRNRAIFVANSGNVVTADDNQMIDAVPALWNDYLPITVVGAVDNTGIIPAFAKYQPNPRYSKAGPNVYAPGAAVQVAIPASLSNGATEKS